MEIDMAQNTSHAVMAQRKEPKDSLDDFPTPPWATRALLNMTFSDDRSKRYSCLEPACNRGFMARALKEYFGSVETSDIKDYGYEGTKVLDFLKRPYEPESFDWVITNPPFNLAGEFIKECWRVSRHGFCLLVRTSFLEGVGRYNNIFSKRPPTGIYQFSERVPMVKGRLDKNASTATSYCWLLWEKNLFDEGDLEYIPIPWFAWIDPCRKELEKEGDYDV
jgi:hypothetical protein